MQGKEWYEVLEISEDADTATIKASYKKLALEWHPDKNPGGEERFKAISNAYQEGIDHASRKSPSSNPTSKSEPSAYSFGSPISGDDKVDVEKVLRAIITAINPLKKGIPLLFGDFNVKIGGPSEGAYVLTFVEVGDVVLTLKYLINKIIQPTVSSALGTSGQKDYIEELFNNVHNSRSIPYHPIYKTSVPLYFYISNELLRFYLAIFLDNTEFIENAINEVQSAKRWVEGVNAELKHNNVSDFSLYLDCKKGGDLSLLIEACKDEAYDKLSVLYKILESNGVESPAKYYSKCPEDSLCSISITIPFEDLKGLDPKWPMLEEKERIDKLYLAIDGNNLEEVKSVLILIPKDTNPKIVNTIFNLAIDTTRRKDVGRELEIVKALTLHFKGSMTKEMKDELFVNAIGKSTASIVAFLHSEFQRSFIFNGELKTVGDNFAKRFYKLFEDAECKMFFENIKNNVGSVSRGRNIGAKEIEKYCSEELTELRKIRRIIEPRLAECAEIKDSCGGILRRHCDGYGLSVFDELFPALIPEEVISIENNTAEGKAKEIEAEGKAKEIGDEPKPNPAVIEAEPKPEEIKLQRSRLVLGATVGLLTGCVALYGLRATTSWPKELLPSVCLVTGFTLVVGILSYLSASLHSVKDLGQ